MTVIVDDGSLDQGSHVLLIGVGHYPFLEGGTPPPGGKLFDHHMKMGQLSSPPISALDFAHWFVDPAAGFHNPDRPLRSLQLLCSAAKPVEWVEPGGNKRVVERAQMLAVKKAITEWVARASRNEENLAILYFCGHGLSFGETQNALLLEDFGGNPLAPMADAIHFDELRMGLMQQCEARYQCHFIDACRTQPTNAFEEKYGPSAGERNIVTGGLNKRLRNRVAPVFFATGLTSPSYGLQDQASLFTQAVMKCFRGVGSRDADDHWDVSVPAIAEGINKCVESLAFATQPQYCQPRDTGQPLLLHRLREDPEVIVKVSMRDEGQLAQTLFACTHDGTLKRQQREPRDIPWWVPLPLGSYTFEAFAANDLAQALAQRKKSVAPPSAEVRL